MSNYGDYLYTGIKVRFEGNQDGLDLEVIPEFDQFSISNGKGKIIVDLVPYIEGKTDG